MRAIRYFTLLWSILILCAFAVNDKFGSEYEQLQKFELLALQKEKVGKTYTYNITKRKACNKTAITYLGEIKTNTGKCYKVLSSFFVFSAENTCHGTSNIKIYDMENQFIGKYRVDMPDELPVKITDNKFLRWSATKKCDLRKGFSVNFDKGPPHSFFLPCSKKDGNQYSFSNE